jgi:AhpD family alkylhydroperoxidase
VTTAQARHYPTMAQRKPGSTVALLRRASDLRAIYVDRRLDPAFREKVMLAVAGANSCRQCSFAHREWALAEGVSDAELAALEGLDPEAFDARTWAAIAWVQAYARSDLEEVPEAIDANFRGHFTAQERSDIRLAARTMYWANEISNSVRSGIKRARGTPVAGSTVPRELEALALYAVGVPPILGFLCVKRRRDPVSMIRDVRPFFREFERRGPDTISGPGEQFGA